MHVPDYYTAPSSHKNNDQIVALEIERDALRDEYALLTADDAEWTAEGEGRCIAIESRWAEIDSYIDYLTYEE